MKRWYWALALAPVSAVAPILLLAGLLLAAGCRTTPTPIPMGHPNPLPEGQKIALPAHTEVSVSTFSVSPPVAEGGGVFQTAYGPLSLSPRDVAAAFRAYGPFRQSVASPDQAALGARLKVRAGCGDTVQDQFMHITCSLFSFGILELIGPIMGRGAVTVDCTVTPLDAPNQARRYASSENLFYSALSYLHTDTAARQTGASVNRCLQDVTRRILADRAFLEAVSAPRMARLAAQAAAPEFAARPDATAGSAPAQTAACAVGADGGTAINCLDYVVFDPDQDRLALVGHHEPQYAIGAIPYLQHLAALLESGNPEFSLNWTPGSEAAVDALFAHVNALREGVIEDTFQDAHGNITPQGRIFLPLFGVRPTQNGRAPGYLGAQTAVLDPNLCKVRVTAVAPGSPAARAGLRPGDVIHFVNRQIVMHPNEGQRMALFAGEGSTMTLGLERGGGEEEVMVRLGASAADPWAHVTPHDFAESVFEAAGYPKLAMFMNARGLVSRLALANAGPGPRDIAWQMMLARMGILDQAQRLRGQVGAGQLSQRDGETGLYRLMVNWVDDEGLQDGSRPTTRDFDQFLRTGSSPGQAWERATSRQLLGRGRQALGELLRRHDEIVVPGEALAGTSGARPMVRPEYIRVDPNSQLARLMFQADTQCKELLYQPELRQRIPGYQTEFEFARKHPSSSGLFGPASTHHLWISVDRLDLAASGTGLTLQTRGADMRFNIRSERGGTATEGAPYAALLTSLYGELARQYPCFHELREAAKVAGAAAWIRSRKPGFSLRDVRKVPWSGPAQVPGKVWLTVAMNRRPGVANASLAAVGGISLVIPHDTGGRLPIGFAKPEQGGVVDLSDVALPTGGTNAGEQVFVVKIPRVLTTQELFRAIASRTGADAKRKPAPSTPPAGTSTPVEVSGGQPGTTPGAAQVSRDPSADAVVAGGQGPEIGKTESGVMMKPVADTGLGAQGHVQPVKTFDPGEGGGGQPGTTPGAAQVSRDPSADAVVAGGQGPGIGKTETGGQRTDPGEPGPGHSGAVDAKTGAPGIKQPGEMSTIRQLLEAAGTDPARQQTAEAQAASAGAPFDGARGSGRQARLADVESVDGAAVAPSSLQSVKFYEPKKMKSDGLKALATERNQAENAFVDMTMRLEAMERQEQTAETSAQKALLEGQLKEVQEKRAKLEEKIQEQINRESEAPKEEAPPTKTDNLGFGGDEPGLSGAVSDPATNAP